MTPRWFIAGLGIGQICSWGSLYYAFPLIAEAMERDLGWAKTDLFIAASAGLVFAGLLAYPVGTAIDRGHGRAVMVGASALAGLFLAGWSQVTTLWAFYALAAGVGALQAATLYEPAFAVIARAVGPANARKGITQLTLWGGFASTVFVPLVQWILSHGGWRDALLALAAVNIMFCTALYATAVGDTQKAVASSADPNSQTDDTGVRQALRMPVLWAFVVALVAYSTTFSAFTFHLYPLLIERQFSIANVVLAMAVIGPAQVAGRIAFGTFAQRASVRSVGCIVVVFFPIAITGLVVAPPTLISAALVAAVYGAANGIFTIVRGMAVPEMISRSNYGAINGALTAPSSIARAVAPAGAAMIWASTGSYDRVLFAIIAGAIVLVLGFWSAALLSRPTATVLTKPT